MRRLPITGAIAAAAVLALAACNANPTPGSGAASGATGTTKGGTLVVLNPGAAVTLDPAKSQNLAITTLGLFLRRLTTWDIQPGKPDQNAYIERFNRTYRTEVLNANVFESLEELQALTDTWLRVYNEERPHDSLGRVPPLTFLPRPQPAVESPLEVSA